MPSLRQRLSDLGDRTRGLTRVDGHRVEMADGVRLATDVHRPAGTGRHPVVVIRTPYGRDGLTGIPMVVQAKVLAAAGYAVVLQDVRGRSGSGGAFLPMVNEPADGARTVEWVHDQPWCDGHVGAFGLSYLGATAWAAATAVPEMVDALCVGIAHSRLGAPDERGVRHLDTSLRWLTSLEAMAAPDRSAVGRIRDLVAARLADQELVAAMEGLPVAELDVAVLGRRSPVWQAWIDHPDPADAFWSAADRRTHLAAVGPTQHITGWWDVFADQQLQDHAVQQRQRPTGLVVGPWGHLDPRVQVESLQQARRHFDVHLRGLVAPDPVTRVWLSGAERWWTPGAWPPPHREAEWLLTRGRLRQRDAVTAEDVTWRYDPSDPTPSSGGRSLSLDAGRVDCTALEARPDVVVHTSAPLEEALTLVGPAALHATVAADTGSADLWVRLTDVDRRGRSTSVADGYVRTHPGEGTADVAVRLHPVAHRFAEGHRLRVLIAGGAFPAFDRNLGHGPGADPLRTTALHPTAMRLVGGASLCAPVL